MCPKAKDTMVKIYVLKDPRNNSVRYVGATISTLKKRLTGHIWDATIALGLARNSIKNNLRGRSATCGGFIWKYKNKETPESGRKPFSNHKKWTK